MSAVFLDDTKVPLVGVSAPCFLSDDIQNFQTSAVYARQFFASFDHAAQQTTRVLVYAKGVTKRPERLETSKKKRRHLRLIVFDLWTQATGIHSQ